jgi:hypothetical protein
VGCGERNGSDPGKPRNQHHSPKPGTAFVYTVPGDHSRVAYAEIHDDETAAPAIGVLRRAVDWSARGSPPGGCRPTTARPTAPAPGVTPPGLARDT